MRTPLRLAATITKFWIAQVARGNSGASPLYRWVLQFGASKLVAVTDEAAIAGKHSIKSHLKKKAEGRAQALRKAPFGSSPIVWLTGPAELLDHSVTPGLARWLQEGRRTVFVETDGSKLRRRIHEFRPDSRLYITIRLYGMAETHDALMQKEGAFTQAMEGMRTAQLSGFLICAHVIVEATTELGEIDQLLRHLRALHVDGVVVTTSDETSGPGQKKVTAARKLIGNSWWTKFSELAQKALNALAHTDEATVVASRANGAMGHRSTSSAINMSRETAASGEEMAAQ
ncbi:MAG TPA: hypothetical protein VKF79_06135 [Candidatus Acidoferrum sp.]|nr:hypothetical protein [Candidatus Acidoferrum sp.]